MNKLTKQLLNLIYKYIQKYMLENSGTKKVPLYWIKKTWTNHIFTMWDMRNNATFSKDLYDNDFMKFVVSYLDFYFKVEVC